MKTLRNRPLLLVLLLVASQCMLHHEVHAMSFLRRVWRRENALTIATAAAIVTALLYMVRANASSSQQQPPRVPQPQRQPLPAPPAPARADAPGRQRNSEEADLARAVQASQKSHRQEEKKRRSQQQQSGDAIPLSEQLGASKDAELERALHRRNEDHKQKESALKNAANGIRSLLGKKQVVQAKVLFETYLKQFTTSFNQFSLVNLIFEPYKVQSALNENPAMNAAAIFDHLSRQEEQKQRVPKPIQSSSSSGSRAPGKDAVRKPEKKQRPLDKGAYKPLAAALTLRSALVDNDSEQNAEFVARQAEQWAQLAPKPAVSRDEKKQEQKRQESEFTIVTDPENMLGHEIAQSITQVQKCLARKDTQQARIELSALRSHMRGKKIGMVTRNYVYERTFIPFFQLVLSQEVYQKAHTDWTRGAQNDYNDVQSPVKYFEHWCAEQDLAKQRSHAGGETPGREDHLALQIAERKSLAAEDQEVRNDNSQQEQKDNDPDKQVKAIMNGAEARLSQAQEFIRLKHQGPHAKQRIPQSPSLLSRAGSLEIAQDAGEQNNNSNADESGSDSGISDDEQESLALLPGAGVPGASVLLSSKSSHVGSGEIELGGSQKRKKPGKEVPGGPSDSILLTPGEELPESPEDVVAAQQGILENIHGTDLHSLSNDKKIAAHQSPKKLVFPPVQNLRGSQAAFRRPDQKRRDPEQEAQEKRKRKLAVFEQSRFDQIKAEQVQRSQQQAGADAPPPLRPGEGEISL